jgi:hypothetical protein
MAAKNDITGDSILSKSSSKAFDKGFDGIDWSVKLEVPQDGDQRLNNEGKLERYYGGQWNATGQKETT